MYPIPLMRITLTEATYPTLITMFQGDIMRQLVQEEMLSRHYEVMVQRKDLYPVFDTKKGVSLTRWYNQCALSSNNEILCFNGVKFSDIKPETCYYRSDKIIYLLEGQVHIHRKYGDKVLASDVALLSMHKHNPILLTRGNEVVIYDNDVVQSRHTLPSDTYISFEMTRFGPWCYVAVLNNKRCLNVYQMSSETTLVRTVEDVDAIASYNGVFGYFHNNKVVIWTMSGEVSHNTPHLVSFLHTQMFLDVDNYQVRLFPLSEVIAYHTQRKEYMFIELYYR